MWKLDEKTVELMQNVFDAMNGLTEDEINVVSQCAEIMKKKSGDAGLRLQAQIRVIENTGVKSRDLIEVYRREDCDPETIILHPTPANAFDGHYLSFHSKSVDGFTVWLHASRIDGDTYEDVFVGAWLDEHYRDSEGNPYPDNVLLPVTFDGIVECVSHYYDKDDIAEKFEKLAARIRALPVPE